MKYIDEPWHIRLTEENEEEVLKWFGRTNINMEYGTIIGMVQWDYTTKLSKGWNGPHDPVKSNSYDHGVEISYQEFKENILKQIINYEIY